MNEMRIYVASLYDYNDGRLEGKWLDLSDYSNASELMEAIQEMLDELTEKYKSVDGEVREEFAVHDYEGIPSTLASEYMGEQDFQQLYDIAEVADDRGIPVEVLIERAGDTGSDDYQALADSLMLVVDGNDESDIVSEYEFQLGSLGYDFWSNHIYIDGVTERVMYGEDVDRFREDILYDNPDMDEDEAERQAEEMANEEEYRREDLTTYLEDMGYEGEIPSFVSKDYEGAWKRSLSYDLDVIHHDGEMYVFSNNYSLGGTILSGMIGAYIGYKVGRAKPQKKGFETEKRIGRKIKGSFSKKKMAKGGRIETIMDLSYGQLLDLVMNYNDHIANEKLAKKIAEIKGFEYDAVDYADFHLVVADYLDQHTSNDEEARDVLIQAYQKTGVEIPDYFEFSEEYAQGGGVGEDVSKSLYVSELYDDDGNFLGYTIQDKYNVSGKYTLTSSKERAEENRQYLIDNPSRLAYYRKNEYARGGSVEKLADLMSYTDYLVQGWDDPRKKSLEKSFFGKNIDVKVNLISEGNFKLAMAEEISKIKMLSEKVDFDEVRGEIDYGKGEDNTNLQFYKNGQLVMTLKGDYNSENESLDTIIELNGETTELNYHPADGFGGVSLSTLNKNIYDAFSELGIYSAVVSIDGYEEYAEDVEGLENAKELIQNIKGNTKFQVLKGRSVGIGKRVDDSRVVEEYAKGGGIKEGFAIMQRGSLRTDAFGKVEVFATKEKALFKMSHVPFFKTLSKEEKEKLIVPYTSSKMAKGGSTSKSDLDILIDEINEKSGGRFYLGGAYGNYELWGKDKDGGDHRIEVGSRKDIREALIKNRYNSKFTEYAKGGEVDGLKNVRGTAYYVSDSSVSDSSNSVDSVANTFFDSESDFYRLVRQGIVREYYFNVEVKNQWNINQAIYDEMESEGLLADEGNVQLVGYELSWSMNHDFESNLPYDKEEEDEEDDNDDDYAKGGSTYQGGGEIKTSQLELHKWYTIDGKELRYFGERGGQYAFQTKHYQEVLFTKPKLDKATIKGISTYQGGGEIKLDDNVFIVKNLNDHKGYKKGQLVTVISIDEDGMLLVESKFKDKNTWYVSEDEVVKRNYAKGGGVGDKRNRRVLEILDEVTDYEDIDKKDIPKIFTAESFEKGLDDDEIQTKINKHLIRLGYTYDYDNYKWVKQYAKGGGIGFKALSNKVAKRYEGKAVAPKYQGEYGKRYSKSEAKEVGDKVAGKVYWQQQGRKMAKGGGVDGKKYFTIYRDEEGSVKTEFNNYSDALADYNEFASDDANIALYEVINGENDLLKENQSSAGIEYVELSNGDIVVTIEKIDGKWEEGEVLDGETPYGWGGKRYMGYLKPKDLAQWLNKDYGGYFEIVDQYAKGGSTYKDGGVVEIREAKILVEDLQGGSNWYILEFQNPKQKLTLAEATKKCKSFGEGWRLPTRIELEYLLRNQFNISNSIKSYWTKDQYNWGANGLCNFTIKLENGEFKKNPFSKDGYYLSCPHHNEEHYFMAVRTFMEKHRDNEAYKYYAKDTYKIKYAEGGGVDAEQEFVITLQHSETGELLKLNVLGRDEENAIDNAYMEADLNQPYDVVDVEKYAKGGGVDGKKYYMLFNLSEFKEKPMYNHIATSKQEVLDILLESYESIVGHKMYGNGYTIQDLDESKYKSYINDDYAYVTDNVKEYEYNTEGYKGVSWQKVNDNDSYAKGGGISGLDDLLRG
jgi:hypothetical protein